MDDMFVRLVLHGLPQHLFYSVIDLQLQELNDRFSETYIFDIHSNKEFEGLNDLGDLAKKLVLTKKDKVYSLVYRLLTLTVVTATVERVFSALSIIKDRLCNRMDNQWMKDSTIVYNMEANNLRITIIQLGLQCSSSSAILY
ncbi:uncharacterized protein LOC111395326 [Olea europaea var. sylvestris]|uniref:uncharacterized protein LOC111395326 n=1 Tax=Olea europaea var. sylvestris TaxID=158386 RepID=UPI000C1D0649|nr:uncharacterized protein LOC111395326 [Olea europaea var. sylvestris]